MSIFFLKKSTRAIISMFITIQLYVGALAVPELCYAQELYPEAKEYDNAGVYEETTEYVEDATEYVEDTTEYVEEQEDFAEYGIDSISYNPTAAVTYARNNANSSSELCAGFVSKCLQAGGVSIYQAGVGNLYRGLKSLGFEEYTLNYSWPNVYTGSNSGKGISVGDVLIYKDKNVNSTAPYCHAAIISKIDSSGRVYITQTNVAAVDYNGAAAYKKGSLSCQAGNITVYCLHYPGNASAADTTPPVISDVRVEYGNISTYTSGKQEVSSYKVSCVVTDNVGVKAVKFPSWAEYDGGDQAEWIEGKYADGRWYAWVKNTNHDYRYGRYVTDIYAYDTSDNRATICTARATLWISGQYVLDSNYRPIEDGVYFIGNACSSSYSLDVPGDTYDYQSGVRAEIWDNMGNVYDRYLVEYAGKGFYTIKHYGSNKALTVYNSGYTNCTPVQFCDFNGSDAQLWRLYDYDGGYYGLQSKCSEETYLDTENGLNRCRLNLEMNEFRDRDTQRWRFVLVQSSAAATSAARATESARATEKAKATESARATEKAKATESARATEKAKATESAKATGGAKATPTAVPVKPTVTPTPSRTALKNPVWNGDEVTWDCVWFGNYWQKDTDGDKKATTNDAKQPIKWRVLQVEGDNMLLLADDGLDAVKYNETNIAMTWDKSTVRSWLNGYDESANTCNISYIDDNFISNAFSEKEIAAMNVQNVHTEDNPYYKPRKIPGGEDTWDKIYLMSIDEVINPKYGFVESGYGVNDKFKCIHGTDFARARGVVNWNGTKNAAWWLRSPGFDEDMPSTIEYAGFVYCGGGRYDDAYNAIRPVINVKLSSDTWTYAGTVNNAGSVNEIKPAPSPTATPTATPTVTPTPTSTVNPGTVAADTGIEVSVGSGLDTMVDIRNANKENATIYVIKGSKIYVRMQRGQSYRAGFNENKPVKNNTYIDVYDNGSSYRITIIVEKPKARKKTLYTSNNIVTYNVQRLLGTNVDYGRLYLIKAKHSQYVEIGENGNEVHIDTTFSNNIKLQYVVGKKKYNITIKVK